MERRSSSLRNRIERAVHPIPLPIALGQRLVPAALGVLIAIEALWAPPPNIIGVFPVDVWLPICAVVTAASALFLRLRPLAFVAVGLAELGLSMTLLFQGSPAPGITRDLELFGSALHGTLWLTWLACYVTTETLSSLRNERLRSLG